MPSAKSSPETLREYLARRQTYIGGADAAAVLGRNPYVTRLEVWLAKTRPVDELLELQISSPHIQRGVTMEPIVIEHLQQIDPSVHPGSFMRDPVYPFLGGTPDAVGEEYVYEIKCPTMANLTEYLKSGLPEYWLWQAHHYTLLTGKPVRVVLWHYDEWRPIFVDVPPSQAAQDMLLQAYVEFWQHVQSRVPPDEEIVNVDLSSIVDLARLIGEYVLLKRTAEDIQARMSGLRSAILSHFDAPGSFSVGGYVVRVSERESSSGSKYRVLTVQ